MSTWTQGRQLDEIHAEILETKAIMLSLAEALLSLGEMDALREDLGVEDLDSLRAALRERNET